MQPSLDRFLCSNFGQLIVCRVWKEKLNCERERERERERQKQKWRKRDTWMQLEDHHALQLANLANKFAHPSPGQKCEFYS